MANKKEKEEDSYETDFTCRNCGKHINLKIPKRTRVSDFIISKRCPNCECKLR